MTEREQRMDDTEKKSPDQKTMRQSVAEAKDSPVSTSSSSATFSGENKPKKKFDARGASISMAFNSMWYKFNYPLVPLYPLTFVPTMSVPEYIAKYGSVYYDLHTRHEENISLCGITMNKQNISPTMSVCDLFGFGPDKEVSIKLIVSKSDMVEDEFERFYSSLGCVMAVGVTGYPGKCERGQLCIFAKSYTLLSAYPDPKINPDPNSTKYKKVTEDLLSAELYLNITRDKEVRKTFRIRNKIVDYMIRFLMKQYLFKEKPLIAKPFVNHHVASFHALPWFYMWRQLMIGGFAHVFEIGKRIRSKGIDLAHVQEIITYTLCVDFNRNELMELTEKMLSGMVKDLTGSYKMNCHANGLDKDPIEIDFEPPFSRIDLLEELEKLSLPETTASKLNELVKHSSEKSVNPTFIIYQPKIMGILEKHHSLDSSLIEGFELFINKHEVFNGFVALDDPVSCIQKIWKIKDRELSEEEARVLVYGLIPTGTWGVGMDRLAMLLTNSDNFEVLGRLPQTNWPVVNVLKTHLDHVRYVPELAFFREEWFGYQKGNFNQRFEEFLNDDNDDPQKVLLNFMRPQTDQFYCFHCRKVVTGTINDVDDNYEVLCDRCLGWVLLEMDPEHLDEVPAPPINMGLVKTRLIPKELSPQLVAEPLENTFRSITVSEEDPVDDACRGSSSETVILLKVFSNGSATSCGDNSFGINLVFTSPILIGGAGTSSRCSGSISRSTQPRHRLHKTS